MIHCVFNVLGVEAVGICPNPACLNLTREATRTTLRYRRDGPEKPRAPDGCVENCRALANGVSIRNRVRRGCAII